MKKNVIFLSFVLLFIFGFNAANSTNTDTQKLISGIHQQLLRLQSVSGSMVTGSLLRQRHSLPFSSVKLLFLSYENTISRNSFIPPVRMHLAYTSSMPMQNLYPLAIARPTVLPPTGSTPIKRSSGLRDITVMAL